MAYAAIRSMMLINGGAAVAILAFIGALVSRADLTSIRDLAGSLVWFAYGVVLCGLAYGAAYLALMGATRHFGQYEKSWSHPWVQSNRNGWHYFSVLFEWFAMAATVASLAMFVLGVLDVRNAVNQIKTISSNSRQSASEIPHSLNDTRNLSK
jgi:uncharacterized membrane protein YdfJ with MMPL/SSD domain